MTSTSLPARIHDWTQSARTTILQTLRSFVAMETINHAPEGNEHDAQMAYAAACRVLGCDTDVYEISTVPGLLEHAQYWRERPCTGRPNVTATRKGSGGGRSLLMSGHMDTVGPGPDPWNYDPFGGEIDNGKFYGLGSYDMKGGVIASLMVVKALNDLQINLKGDLLIESVVDEESGGCNGSLAARLKYHADFAILTEPTNLTLCPAHLGGLGLRVSFKGKPGIGISRPIDPTRPLARFLEWLHIWNQTRQKNSHPPFYAEGQGLTVGCSQLQAGATHLNYLGDRIPSRAWTTVFISTQPGDSQDAVMQDLQAAYAQVQASDEVLRLFTPEWEAVRWLDGSEISPDHEGVQTLAGVLRDVRRQDAEIGGAMFQCDGHMFNLYGQTPTVVFGPSGGNPHAPDEHIVIDDYLIFIETLIRGAIDWCGVEQ